MKFGRILAGAVIFVILAFIAKNLIFSDYNRLKKSVVRKFGSCVPSSWGEVVKGVKTRLDTKRPVLALTLDACGSKGDGFDADLINYLVKEKIPVTLFISGKWMDKNPEIFKDLSKNNLFEIENHGLEHRPCSVKGNSAYGIKGTDSASGAMDEIELNSQKIKSLTGHKPKFYRSGTAYYDEVAVEIASHLGYQVIGFSVIGDAGATYSKEQIKKALLKGIWPGEIMLCHMNHPECETAEGLIEAIPELEKMGFRFVKLRNYKLK
ncbi:MAG: polysaccharide deacetylase family protein [Candidatus Omnitrophica bacterium]|nr:polysaccharide deacetylase family protein [Candidatus Omnitrophota bacterium]